MLFLPTTKEFIVIVIGARRFVLSLVLGSIASLLSGEEFTQKPSVETVRVQDKEIPGTPPTKLKTNVLEEGPRPMWIWGKNPNTKYYLRKTFEGKAKSAKLKATCDNQMTLFVNGKRVASNGAWESPVTADVTQHLVEGTNELLAEVANAGGPSGFVCKLALTNDGETKYILSDKSWKVSESRDAKATESVKPLGRMGTAPWGNVFDGSKLASGPRGVFEVLPGFRVELLFTVPKGQLGSWVSITFDNKGRLLASDQGKQGICRITPPRIGSDEETKVEKLDLKITSAQGMLYAFDSLYISVNGGPGSGLYRARDTTGNDQFDEVVKLKAISGGGEHGPHALRLAPDGKSIYLIAGNATRMPDKFEHSRIPTNWKEDLLLPRMWDANGHARGRLAPGGWIAKTDPDGKSWEVFSMGYRNPYDMDFNADGELFAYDADMEWDMGTPWYRPTRVVHATSGSEFGWRSGTGKWPAYYIDSLPPLVNIGPGSPVGAGFGYGAKFPAKYQKALYICDWTFGTMYAIHIEPDGASYKATKEEFLSRAPLPLTDVAIGPDGAMYFTVGGRGTQSALYRVTYVGKESTEPADARSTEHADLRKLRQELERYHRPIGKEAVDAVWPHLSHADRHIRYAARVALEHQPVALWEDRVLEEKSDVARIEASVALARQGDASLQPKLLALLDQIDFGSLKEAQQLGLLRVWMLVFTRMGEPESESAKRLGEKLDKSYPVKSDSLNRELCTLLVYLKAPSVLPKTIALMKRPSESKPSDLAELIARNRGYGGPIARLLADGADIQKLHYALALRNVREGWTASQGKFYYQWLQDATKKNGGSSFRGFIRNIDNEAYTNTNDVVRLALESSGLRQPYRAPELPNAKGPGKKWKLKEVLSLAKTELKGRNFANGKRAFEAARCVVCHRFNGDGGATGPDLTLASNRFAVKDLCEALMEPNKVISDQYRAIIVSTSKGQTHLGRIISDTDKSITLLVDPEDSTKVVEIAKSDIEEQTPSPTSLMPAELLDPLNKDELLDLLAYLLSRGNAKDPLFKR